MRGRAEGWFTMQYFVFFDDIYHPLGDDETTTCCGVVVAHETPWVSAVPDGATLHTDAPKPKSKAKAKK